MPVRIIVDSAADVQNISHPQLTVLPLSIAFGSDTYLDGETITHERFFEMLIESDELPSTGQINPYAFSCAIESAQAAGEDVVVLTLSGKLSGTHQSAVTAASQVEGEVHVVDTQTVCIGERILVRYALQLLDEGRSAGEIAAAIEEARERVVVLALLDTLEYLRRGGRIPSAVGVVGEMLSIKPVVAVEDGLVTMRGKARGSKNGRNLLTQQIAAHPVDFSMPLCTAYSGLSSKMLDKYVADLAPHWEGKLTREQLDTTSVGATIGTHVGPGAIAVAYFAQE